MQKPSHRFAEIVLGVDAREPAAAALRLAFDCALLWGARLRAVHAWRYPSCAAELPFGIPEEDRGVWEDHEVQLLSDALRPWREKYPEVPVLEDVRHLPPADALVRQSTDAELVIVGRGRDGRLGAVARNVLRDAAGPVVVVPVQGRMASVL
ncbi:nucleotide-binding universal stress UspA family protein [Streptomyces sp. SAI-208]|uniref:universal stress protein n=1 Tax=unclassified Streptomyces TaxID=2593676 RepID=UPI002476B0BB|nr:MULTISPECIES: universal stress protein [unclassified Streptomyces]MDH6521420.1 nucleotide-binding universal stress UspA family protein [Streptomyces sp. SAI-090]MDH6572724.1 nucleotide-binding universal stress UspA family protein [Streptomyces sp. SAI-117]MDH6582314.1 nucleotide-binding universal stress UspA family protein [Streptomyces sp. SAI-133]MDH6612420.1 nucleotide-binding universal stress UspA family protein [Streptomyces sp. SAI-208]MDH6614483.1 nucleotide-binding universal stress 